VIVKDVDLINPKKLLTFENAARRRATTRANIHSLVKRDKIPVVEVDGRFFIDEDDLASYNPEENKGGKPSHKNYQSADID
jgi:hypothetical protein